MPPETAPSQRQGPRAPFPALLAGGVIAGFGLGALALSLLLPAPVAAPLPPPAENHAPRPEGSDTPEARSWPAAFGTPPTSAPPAVAPQPQPEEVYEDPDEEHLPYTDHDYRLRGMVAPAGEPGDAQEWGGWALIESEIGIEVVRVGSELSGGETIIEITHHGVILQGFGPEFLLSFSEDDSYDDVGGYSPHSLSVGSVMATHDDHDDDFDNDIDEDDFDDPDDGPAYVDSPSQSFGP